eukprot:comp12576_c0_seq1/m.7580 comp12576_c0_seq1/g.7580  ORF comp12576_c0_seq1/g.7580 comp12576_c0_seq1/m.7580 type:complete len:209 (-) comp12576_c0_seq1:740-1366(-)
MDTLQAARLGHLGVLLLHLEHGTISSDPVSGNTVGHEAVLGNQPACLKAVMQWGWWPDTQNNSGETALFLAAQMGNTDAARLLVESGCDVNLPSYSGWTPILVACHLGHAGVLSHLLRKGCVCEGLCGCASGPDLDRRAPGYGLPARELARMAGHNECWDMLVEFECARQKETPRAEASKELLDMMGLDEMGDGNERVDDLLGPLQRM